MVARFVPGGRGRSVTGAGLLAALRSVLGALGAAIGLFVLLVIGISPLFFVLSPGNAILLVPLGLWLLWTRSIRVKLFGLWALGYAAFASLRGLADAVAPWRTQYPIFVDRVLGLGTVPTVLLQEHFQARLLDVLMSITYLSFHFAFPLVLAASLALNRSATRVVLALLSGFGIALVWHTAFPTVPPWMAANAGAIAPVRRILWDVMYPSVPQIMEAGYRASSNDVAAMPSVHLVLATVTAFALTNLHRSLKWLGMGYVALMSVAVVFLGEHYAADALAGILVGLLGWALAGRATRERTGWGRPDAIPGTGRPRLDLGGGWRSRSISGAPRKTS